MILSYTCMHTNIHTNSTFIQWPEQYMQKKEHDHYKFFTTHSRPLIYICMYINQKEIIIKIKIKRFNYILVSSITGI